VRVAYLHTTNLEDQILGVFRVENALDEPVTFWSGFYQATDEGGVERSKRDHIADLGGPRRFPPGLTNHFEIEIPANGQPCRLVLRYRADRELSAVRFRQSWASRLPLPASLRQRITGRGRVVKTAYFQFPESRL